MVRVQHMGDRMSVGFSAGSPPHSSAWPPVPARSPQGKVEQRRSWSGRFLGSTEAASLVEMAVFLGVGTVLLLAGIAAVSQSTRDVLTAVVTGRASSLSSSPRTGAAHSSDFIRGGLASAEATASDDRPGIHWHLLLAIAVFIALAGIWQWKRRRRRRVVLTDAESGAPSPEDVQAAVFRKRQDLLRALSSDTGLLAGGTIAVRHLMTSATAVVPPRTTVEQMRQIMAEQRVRHLLVCKGQGELAGVISNGNLARRPGRRAEQIMTVSPITVAPDTPVAQAVSCLLVHGISCLPVIEDGHLRGVITATDMLLALQCALQLWVRWAQAMDAGGAVLRLAHGSDNGLEQPDCLGCNAEDAPGHKRPPAATLLSGRRGGSGATRS